MTSSDRTGIQVERLREWREKRGWSQRELARLCGLGEAQVSKYENGHTDPSASVLKAMCIQLGVSADYVLGLSDSPRGDLVTALREDERKLLESLLAGDGPTALTIVSDMLRQQTK
jgi:transcriptional regulator with XRE-family HTH domain